MSIKSKTELTVLDHPQLYIDSLWRRLKNFNKLLDNRISKFNIKLALGIQRRFIFLLPGVDHIDEYIRQLEGKLEDKAKQNKLKMTVNHFLSKYRPNLTRYEPS